METIFKGLFDTENTYFVIWTTTPWTLPGNMGITIDPEFEYSIVGYEDEKHIIAKELVSKVKTYLRAITYSKKKYEDNTRTSRSFVAKRFSTR